MYDDSKDQVHKGTNDPGGAINAQREIEREKMTIATYVRSAMAEYSNTDARQRLELINNLGTFYRKFREELSWAGSNLNQSVKRANELAVAGLLPPSYIREVLMPVILETQKTLNEIKRDLETATRRAIKL